MLWSRACYSPVRRRRARNVWGETEYDFLSSGRRSFCFCTFGASSSKLHAGVTSKKITSFFSCPARHFPTATRHIGTEGQCTHVCMIPTPKRQRGGRFTIPRPEGALYSRGRSSLVCCFCFFCRFSLPEVAYTHSLKKSLHTLKNMFLLLRTRAT